MASLFVHAVLPLVAARAFAFPKGYGRRAALVGALCGCLPDLDVITYALEVRAPEPLGHRGLSHSLLVALVVAALATLFVARGLARTSPHRKRIFLFFFASAAAHGLLDVFTQGEVGVALFAPFSFARIASPWKLLPACPVGLTEFLGYFGLLTLANEVLFVVAPVAVVTSLLRARRPQLDENEPTQRRVLALACAWLTLAIAARVGMPDTFAAVVPRVLEPVGTTLAGDPAAIPHDDLPNGKLVSRLDELEKLGLLGRRLEPMATPWSSSFFPSWYGGEAGRWSEGSVTLGLRTLTGFSAPTEAEARAWVAAAEGGDVAARERLFTLAPTEKVDIALGHFDFPATKQGLSHSHNGHPRYWSGRCNGIANASLVEPEPYRVVDVVSVEGHKVRFHPNDVKSLLSVAYYETEFELGIGEYCGTVAFDSGATCSMNPAVLVLALANRLGIARTSFLIDALPTIAKQYYAVAGATVSVLGPPRPVADTPRAKVLNERVERIVDVRIELLLSSTTLPYRRASVLEPSGKDRSEYRRVGLVPVTMVYKAELALDRDGELIGGRYTGDPADGPDAILLSARPKVDAQGKLATADKMPWPFVRELAKKSVANTVDPPVLDLRTCESCR